MFMFDVRCLLFTVCTHEKPPDRVQNRATELSSFARKYKKQKWEILEFITNDCSMICDCKTWPRENEWEKCIFSRWGTRYIFVWMISTCPIDMKVFVNGFGRLMCLLCNYISKKLTGYKDIAACLFANNFKWFFGKICSRELLHSFWTLNAYCTRLQHNVKHARKSHVYMTFFFFEYFILLVYMSEWVSERMNCDIAWECIFLNLII